MEKLEELFKLREGGTSVETKVLAGITIFMIVAYVLVVQLDAIIGFGDAVSSTDINELAITKEAIAVTCAVTNTFAALFVDFYVNPSFALTTGMGMNSVFGALLQSNILSFSAIMAITLISGLIFVVLTISGVRDLVVRAAPKNIKMAIGSIIGFYIVYLDFKSSDIRTLTNETGMGSFREPAVFIALLSPATTAVLATYRINGAIPIGAVAVTVMGIPLGVTILPGTFAKTPNVPSWGGIVFCSGFKGLSSFQVIIYVLIVFCRDFFSTLRAALGVAGKAGMLDEDGNVSGIQKPLLVDATGACVGTCTGNATIATFVKSTLGVEVGGRAGLTGIVVAVLFAVMMFFSSLTLMILGTATGPALIFVGFLVVLGIRNIDFSDFTEALGLFVMVTFVTFCGSIVVGVAADTLAYIIIKTATDKFKELHPATYVSAVSLAMYLMFKQQNCRQNDS